MNLNLNLNLNALGPLVSARRNKPKAHSQALTDDSRIYLPLYSL